MLTSADYQTGIQDGEDKLQWAVCRLLLSQAYNLKISMTNILAFKVTYPVSSNIVISNKVLKT